MAVLSLSNDRLAVRPKLQKPIFIELKCHLVEKLKRIAVAGFLDFQRSVYKRGAGDVLALDRRSSGYLVILPYGNVSNDRLTRTGST